MRTCCALLFFLFLFPFSLHAQETKKKEKKIYLGGYVSDSFTKA